ncbi:MAG: GTPase ObgE [Flexilinea sp.]
MFIDEAQIYIRSGKGGDGFMHFHREKFVARGGPDGGDGGHGGDLIFKVEKRINTLAAFRHKTKYIAGDGLKGGVNNRTGRSAENLVVLVPAGTIVTDADTGLLLGDLLIQDQELVVAKGGRGGRGNPHFVSSSNQAPRVAEKGAPAEEKRLKLELKLVADIGIVGVPNAGKSSFLASVTAATPKIADYPFTTVEPNLGVAELDLDHSLVLSDVPGLIEGAHLGVGLGDSFLRHIQRTKVILHLLNGMSDDPIADFDQINQEMALYDPNLAEKPQLVVFNKMDIPEAANIWPDIEKELKGRGYEPMSISAATKQNVTPVLWKLYELLQNIPETETQQELPLYVPPEDPREFTISQDKDGDWVVQGVSIERAAKMTFWEHSGSVRRFQTLLRTLGIETALRKAGIQNGDTVMIGEEYELEWVEE